MDLSRFALRIIESPRLEDKLAPPPRDLSDGGSGHAAPQWPARSESLRIVPARASVVPKLRGWREIRQRRRILHALANHELQAVELYARALVSFHDSEAELRSDLFHILLEEQLHTRAYIEQLRELDGGFGDFPVSGYFWNKAPLLDTPLRFACVMSLTFENANLDHSLEARDVAASAGDATGARLFEQVHEDEIGHVRFGWKWLTRWAKDDDPWDVYRHSLSPPLHAGRASGRRFFPEPRRKAGLSESFIERLAAAHARRRETDPGAG